MAAVISESLMARLPFQLFFVMVAFPSPQRKIEKQSGHMRLVGT